MSLVAALAQAFMPQSSHVCGLCYGSVHGALPRLAPVRVGPCNACGESVPLYAPTRAPLDADEQAITDGAAIIAAGGTPRVVVAFDQRGVGVSVRAEPRAVVCPPCYLRFGGCAPLVAARIPPGSRCPACRRVTACDWLAMWPSAPRLGIGAAYHPRDRGSAAGRDHAILLDPFVYGQLRRSAGDALCRPAKQFWGLQDVTSSPRRLVSCVPCLEKIGRLLMLERERAL